MKKLVLLVMAIVVVIVLAFGVSVANGATGCQNGSGWTKVEGSDHWSVPGATAYCYKYGSPNSQGCTGGLSDSWPPVGVEKPCGLSHWSYFIPEVPPTDPPVDPTEPPVPTDPPVDPTEPPVPTDPPVDPTEPPVTQEFPQETPVVTATALPPDRGHNACEMVTRYEAKFKTDPNYDPGNPPQDYLRYVAECNENLGIPDGASDNLLLDLIWAWIQSLFG